MKKLVLSCLLSLLLPACAVKPAEGLPERINTIAGQTFTIPLEANPSTGSDWKVTYDREMIEFSGYDSGNGSELPGDQVYRIYSFEALRPGETVITLTYGRFREAGFAVETISKTLKIPVSIE